MAWDPDAPDALRRRRLRAQRLDAAARADDAEVADVVRAVGGVQAQDMRAATLGVALRSGWLTSSDVTQALDVSRTTVRTWCMRGTLHLVPAGLLAPLLAVFGPVLVGRGRRRLADLGLDDAACARGVALIGEVLGGRRLRTRDEVADAVRRRDHSLDVRGQAAFHLLRRACLEGVACEAGSREGRPLYGLREEWFPAPMPLRESALAQVARWYVDGFGPVARPDFAAWSGLPAADVRKAWQQLDDLVDVGSGLWTRAPDRGAPTPPRPPTVRLVPAFDGYLLGYRDRAHAVAPQHHASVHPGGGIIRATVLVDGRVTGTWSLRRADRPARLIVATFSGLPGVPVGALDAEAARIRDALDLDISVAMVG